MDKLGGSSSERNASGSADATHPSLTSLPLLGVTYADLYRRVQIQEAVYEALTQQYELAKVQEAKETPSVKVLDPANLPEHKTFPPRLLVLLCCMLLAVCATSAYLIAREQWKAIAPDDSGKLFAQQVFQSMNATMPWSPPNGSPVQAWTSRVWTKFVAKKKSSDEVRDERDLPQN
jgi:hypothetical protein